ncbi:MAG: secretin N-terminal domain-containing protein [Woeseia sp.]
MINKCTSGLVFAFFLIASPVVSAGNPDKPESHDHAAKASMPKTPLAEILESVSKKSGKKFLVDHRVRPSVVVGQPRPKDVSYSSLLQILRNNGLAGVAIDDVVNVVPVGMVRQYPLPVLFDDDPSTDGEEWVTRIIKLENAHAPTLIPIMRPLLPQAGHMAAYPMSNTILIVDRYANVRRVTEMISRIDSLTPAQPDK